MNVPYNYLPMQFENVDEIFEDWRELIKSTDFTLGHYVQKFEDQFSNYVGAKYCIAVNNGTDALILSLKACGIKSGDEVITVCNSFYASTGAIVAVGATPVMVDCDSRYQINVDEIESAISPRTKAILPVHWAGASPDMKRILQIATERKIHVVEDACMGIGGSIDGKHPGTFGTCGAFSLHPLKTLNVMGDGGMVVTDNDDLAKWMRIYRNHGMIDRDHNVMWGVNMRIQPLQAIVAMRGMAHLSEIIEKRNANALNLDKMLGQEKLRPFVSIPERVKGNIETFSLYMGLFEQRDKLMQYLQTAGIEVKIHYPVPLHLQKASQALGYQRGMFKCAEQQANKLMTIPVHQYILEEQLIYTVDKIKAFYNV